MLNTIDKEKILKSSQRKKVRYIWGSKDKNDMRRHTGNKVTPKTMKQIYLEN